jgi:adenylate cyclase
MSWMVKLRIVTGLCVAVYVTLHLLNHALGVFSFEVLDAYRRPMSAVWRSWPGTVALHGALLVHFALALRTIYMKTTLRMPRWEAAQLIIGVLAAPMILGHVVFTRVKDELLGTASSGHPAFFSFIDPTPLLGGQTTVLLVVFTWIHVTIGLHFWLRVKPWYSRAYPVFYAAAVLLPVLALLGFFRAWVGYRELPLEELRAANASWDAATAQQRELVVFLGRAAAAPICFGLVALAFGARWVRLRTLRARSGLRIQHPARGSIVTLQGRTVLEALRDAGVPHASVCGGRGRCTTCRVHIDAGGDTVAAPSGSEAAALARVTSDPLVRLACLLRPTSDLAITPLLPATATARDAFTRGGVSGREQIVTAMFVDLRDSTKLGEERLPYDVVFILNQFFAEMSAALDATNGHYAQFSGDGLLALYGLEAEAAEGARDALRGATEMKRRLELLNERLAKELKVPLRIGRWGRPRHRT